MYDEIIDLIDGNSKTTKVNNISMEVLIGSKSHLPLKIRTGINRAVSKYVMYTGCRA